MLVLINYSYNEKLAKTEDFGVAYFGSSFPEIHNLVPAYLIL